MFKWIMGKRSEQRANRAPEQPKRYEIPTVKLDPARWTETVKADLYANIKALRDVAPWDVDAIYEDALKAFHKGFNLYILHQALLARGMTKKRASEVVHKLSSKIGALMNMERQKRIGVKYAIWRYCAACRKYEAAHKAANDKVFLLAKGMLINRRRRWPGRQDGCRCFWTPVIPGLEYVEGIKPDEIVVK